MLYKEELIKHYKNPKNYGTLENPNFFSGEYNPSCGDSVEFQGIIEGGIIVDLYFTGKGCIISQAMASIIIHNYLKKEVKDFLELKEKNILDMLGFEIGPNRAKCALLSFIALHNGLIKYSEETK